MLDLNTAIDTEGVLIDDPTTVIQYQGFGDRESTFEGKIIGTRSHLFKLGETESCWARRLWDPAPHKLGTVLRLKANARVTVRYNGVESYNQFTGTVLTTDSPSFTLGECRNDWILGVWEPVTGDVWRRAVEDRCTEACIEFYPDDPRRTLENLLQWEARTALDPQVSGSAIELRDTYLKRMNVAENKLAAVRYCLEDRREPGV